MDPTTLAIILKPLLATFVLAAFAGVVAGVIWMVKRFLPDSRIKRLLLKRWE